MKMKMENIVVCAVGLISLLYLYKTFFLTPSTRVVPSYGVQGAPEYVLEGVENEPQTTPQVGRVQAAEELGHDLPAPVQDLNRTPSSCFPQKVLTANELLPRDDSAAISDFNQSYPIGEGVLRGINYLSAGYHIGVNTVGQSLRNANRQIRGEPPNPQVAVSPWLNSTIGPDLERRSLDVTSTCQ